MNDYKKLLERLQGSVAHMERFGILTSVVTREEIKTVADAIEQLVKERDAIERDLAGFEYCPLCAHCHEHIIGTNTETNEEEDLGECGQGNGVFHQLCMNGKFSRCSQYKWRGIQNEI